MAWLNHSKDEPPGQVGGARGMSVPVTESDPSSPYSEKGFSASLPQSMQLLNFEDTNTSRRAETNIGGQEHEDLSSDADGTSMPTLSSTPLFSDTTPTSSSNSLPVHNPVQAEEPNDPAFAVRTQHMREKAVALSVHSSELATSDLGSELEWSWGSASSGAVYACHKCKLYRDGFPSTESYDFWQSVDNLPSCHSKYFKHLLKKLEEKFPGDGDLLKDRKVVNFLRAILHVKESDDAAEVELKDYVRLVRFFGPVCEESAGKCILLAQLKIIIEKSLQYKDSKKKEKISWFAGDISREKAEELLQNKETATYLVRMSRSNAENGDFAISVKHEGDIYHFEIKGNPEDAVKSRPFSANLLFHNKRFHNLPEVIEEIKTNSLSPDDNPELDIWCRHICPGLPLNAQICGYKKSHR